jgi:ribosomal protein S18 acetylase RimI-like enzyme
MTAIRDATPEDIPAMVRARIDAWKRAYTQIIPASYLDNMSYAMNETRWRDLFKAGLPPRQFWLAAEYGADGVVGFCSGGPERDEDWLYQGEIYALYIQPAFQGRRIGQALVLEGARRLRRAGFRNMLIWVLTENHAARGFYERMGGAAVRQKNTEIGGQIYSETGYGYDDLDAMLQAAGLAD